MKKLALMLVVISSLMILVSCEKKDENSLVGTTWENVDDKGNISSLEFSENVVTADMKDSNGMVSLSLSGTYTYSHPNVTLTFLGQVSNAIINDSKLVFEGTIYVKK